MEKIFLVLLLAGLLNGSAFAFLYPEDFGLTLNQYNQIDMQSLPPNVVVGYFDGDKYPDIARCIANRVEVYLRINNFFPENPSLVKYYDWMITSIKRDGDNLTQYLDIVVSLANGTEERIFNSPSGLCIEPEQFGFEKYTSPRYVREVDFQLIW